jgi:hypothetical protein
MSNEAVSLRSGSPSSHDDRQRDDQASVRLRTVVIHYHLFKNAGTSIDEMLRRNFGAGWLEQEFPGAAARRSNCSLVGDFLRAHPKVIALSSHTALMPPPVIPGLKVLPIVFVRHPIDRLRSAYGFQREQLVDTLDAQLAKTYDFAGYIRALLALPRAQARNFQTARLAHNVPLRAGTDRERALRAIRRLPFVGLVEAYDLSLQRLSAYISRSFAGFRVVAARKNVTAGRSTTLEERLLDIEWELGSELYCEICAANQDDIELYEQVRARYSTD